MPFTNSFVQKIAMLGQKNIEEKALNTIKVDSKSTNVILILIPEWKWLTLKRIILIVN